MQTSETAVDPGCDALLLQFLRGHDAACPVCGYCLRGLDRAVCPECRHDLVLAVGVRRVVIGPLLAALAPGCFSGMAACVLAIPTIGAWAEDGTLFPPFAGAVLFGLSSGLAAIVLAARRVRFFAVSPARQRWFAGAVWFVHVAALVVFLIALAPFVD